MVKLDRLPTWEELYGLNGGDGRESTYVVDSRPKNTVAVIRRFTPYTSIELMAATLHGINPDVTVANVWKFPGGTMEAYDYSRFMNAGVRITGHG